jgi:hypothetical protein
MMSRYKEVADIVFKYHEHRNPLVRRSITALLPRIAHFIRDRFVSSYLQVRFEDCPKRTPAQSYAFAFLHAVVVCVCLCHCHFVPERICLMEFGLVGMMDAVGNRFVWTTFWQ